ncbi:hypothetical protein [Phenylobacterium sp.]|jgi:hypothetical protein|uniref:hypothetical protein n=1 Tax=Phenylobacterium sp. TaxID=1871053 RepID=UPI0037CC57C0
MSAFKFVGFPGISDAQGLSGTTRNNQPMAISRRALLGGLSAMPLAAGLMGCAVRAQGSPAAPTGPVGPGSAWNGTPLSGGTPPSDPVRTTAKPAAHWLIPSDLRLVANLVVGVDADAKGGVKQVDFWVEGATYSVTTPTILNDNDVNGRPRSRYGFWITLDAAKFRTISATGAARIFATAVPNDTTMQSRVIGITSGDALTDNLRGDYAMTVFPRAVENDWTKTVAPSGADYNSLAAAIGAAASAGAEAPLITITQTGFYELNNATSQSNHANGKGFLTLRAASGVTATLGRSAPFIPNDPASWSWTPGWDGMEFRGAGIVFDQRNWSTISFTAKPAWFNGCKFTNSIGTRDSVYWNAGCPPIFGPSPAHAVYSYWDNVSTEYVIGGFQTARYVQGCNIRFIGADVVSGVHYVCGNYLRDYRYTYFQSEVASLEITYTPLGGQTSATVTKTGADGGQPNLFTLNVNGAPVLNVTLGRIDGDPNQTINQLAATINAFGSGWQARVTARGDFRASSLGGDQGAHNPKNANALNTKVSIVSSFGIHGDWWQGYSGDRVRENVLIRNNITRDAVGNNAFLNNDDASNGGRSHDHIVKGNVWLADPGNTGSGGAGPSYFAGPSTSHYVFEGNTHEAEVVRRQAPPGQDTIYSSYRNNIVLKTYTDGGSAWIADAPWVNNLYVESFVGAMTGGANAGNVTYPQGSFSSLFRDHANGDLRPAVSSALQSSLKARIGVLDGRLQPFAESDIMGAWSKDSGPKTDYPF